MIRYLLIFVLTSTALASHSKQCGRVQDQKDGLNDRVLGGHVAQKRNWPWLVQVFTRISEDQIAQCSGTIISDRHVLTAAHCFPPPKGPVVVSSRTGSNIEKGLVQGSATVHHKYDYNNKYPGYDVAIVTLHPPIRFSDDVQPICIVDSFRENIGDVGYVVGYGVSSVNRTVRVNTENGPMWNFTNNEADGELHENLIQFRTIERCGSAEVDIGSYIRHSERAICAVGNNRVTAQGDSGGPLMINRKGVWYQVGTTSIGALLDYDGQNKWVSMYSRLSRACDWIEEKTSGYVKCVSMDD